MCSSRVLGRNVAAAGFRKIKFDWASTGNGNFGWSNNDQNCDL